MRKITISITCLISFAGLLPGQTPGYSIGVAGDYAGGVIKGSFGLGGKIETHNYFTLMENAKPVTASLGRGYDLQVNILKTFKRNMGVGLGTGFHKGLPVIVDLTSISDESWNANYSNSTTQSTTIYNRISEVQFNPFFKISSRDSIRRPYVKVGFLVCCLGKTSKAINATRVEQYSINDPPPYRDTTVRSSSHTVTDYKGGISFGYTNAVGLEFRIDRNLLFLTECDFSFLQWKPKKIKEPGSAVFTYTGDSQKTPWAYSSLKFKIGVIYTFRT